MQSKGCGFKSFAELHESLNTPQLCYAHVIYLEAILFAVQSGLGSRASAMGLESCGIQPHPKRGKEWRFAPENRSLRGRVLKT